MTKWWPEHVLAWSLTMMLMPNLIVIGRMWLVLNSRSCHLETRLQIYNLVIMSTNSRLVFQYIMTRVVYSHPSFSILLLS
jgi:hypothetical protein